MLFLFRRLPLPFLVHVDPAYLLHHNLAAVCNFDPVVHHLPVPVHDAGVPQRVERVLGILRRRADCRQDGGLRVFQKERRLQHHSQQGSGELLENDRERSGHSRGGIGVLRDRAERRLREEDRGHAQEPQDLQKLINHGNTAGGAGNSSNTRRTAGGVGNSINTRCWNDVDNTIAVVGAIEHDSSKNDFTELVDVTCRPYTGRSASVGDLPLMPSGASRDRTVPVFSKARQQRQLKHRQLALDRSTGATSFENDVQYVVNGRVTPLDCTSFVPPLAFEAKQSSALGARLRIKTKSNIPRLRYPAPAPPSSSVALHYGLGYLAELHFRAPSAPVVFHRAVDQV